MRDGFDNTDGNETGSARVFPGIYGDFVAQDTPDFVEAEKGRTMILGPHVFPPMLNVSFIQKLPAVFFRFNARKAKKDGRLVTL